MTIRSEELAASGAVVSVEVTVLALTYPDGPDKPHSEILSVTKDGADITAERRAKASGRGSSMQGGPPPGMDFPDPFPFGSAAAGNTSLSLLSASPRGFEAYEYRIQGKSNVVGHLRFEGGEIHALDYTIEPLPFYLKAFSGKVLFASAPDASLVAKELSFDADASFLVVRKHYRFSLSFQGWKLLGQTASK
jgi:hypothetical protein